MMLEHVAIWTDNLEELKRYYIKYFGATANEKYSNEESQFQSYFLTFESGARLEIMMRPGIPENKNDRVSAQHKGIIHLAFGVISMRDVDEKQNNCNQMDLKSCEGQGELVMVTTSLKLSIRMITGLRSPQNIIHKLSEVRLN